MALLEHGGDCCGVVQGGVAGGEGFLGERGEEFACAAAALLALGDVGAEFAFVAGEGCGVVALGQRQFMRPGRRRR